MEILRPTPYVSGGNWLLEETTTENTAMWTAAENKTFEDALAVYDEGTPNRWHKVAAMIPGKTVSDVVKHYRELEADVNSIEAGLVPIPGYITSRFTLDWTGNNDSGYDGWLRPVYQVGNKRSLVGRPPEQERKKGVPWTEEEHKRFLMGLKKYGKGDWRSISRNFVITRTPTQVASHAQKYFIRQLSGGKDKRRASIHDITTVNLDEETCLETKTSVNTTPEPHSNSAPVCLGRLEFPLNQTDPFHSSSSSSSSSIGVHSYDQNLQGVFRNDSCYAAQSQNNYFQL